MLSLKCFICLTRGDPQACAFKPLLTVLIWLACFWVGLLDFLSDDQGEVVLLRLLDQPTFSGCSTRLVLHMTVGHIFKEDTNSFRMCSTWLRCLHACERQGRLWFAFRSLHACERLGLPRQPSSKATSSWTSPRKSLCAPAAAALAGVRRPRWPLRGPAWKPKALVCYRPLACWPRREPSAEQC